jgi:signal transduction histidine kinase/ligand-binding sensor domain-containing protein
MGLSHFDIQRREIKTIVPNNRQEYLNDIACLMAGHLFYVGTYNGIFLADTKKRIAKEIPSVDYGVYALLLDGKNRLWVGSDKKLVVHHATTRLNDPIRVYPNTGIINHIVEDKSSTCIWVATSNGLLKINAETLADTLLTERDGLPNQYIYAVVPDKKGNIWLSSNQGIIKYMPYKPKGQQFKQYTVRNGLSANEYCRGAALMSSSGEIWFGSTHGVDVFHPDSVGDIGSAPQLAIVGLKIHDQEWRSDTVCIEMAQRIELKHNQNTLRLELAAMEYTDPEMNKFRVWLSKDGGKPDTVELGTQNFITYANLRPGEYRFEFTACNSEGIWQKTPRRLEIVIHPHFTQTWQFQSLMVALALGMIGFGTAFYYRYRLRVQQLELEKQQREADRKQLLLENELALQHERNRIADEMHDELGGGLSTIRLASERAKKMKSPEDLQGILQRVSQISIGLVGNMRGIIWAMDTQNDSLNSLLAYIRQYARTFLDDNALAADIKMPAEYPDLALSGQYRHNVMLTVKECLNNILKHAEASEVSLHISVGNELLITIRDNGKGFNPAEKLGSGKGLRTTAKRMESVGGSIEWTRNEEGGMTTFLRAPL